MKKIILFIAAPILCLGFTGCSKDDDHTKSASIAFTLDGNSITTTSASVSKLDSNSAYQLSSNPNAEYNDIYIHDPVKDVRMHLLYSLNLSYVDTYISIIYGGPQLYPQEYNMHFDVSESHHIKGTFSGTLLSSFEQNDPTTTIYYLTNGTFDIWF